MKNLILLALVFNSFSLAHADGASSHQKSSYRLITEKIESLKKKNYNPNPKVASIITYTASYRGHLKNTDVVCSADVMFDVNKMIDDNYGRPIDDPIVLARMTDLSSGISVYLSFPVADKEKPEMFVAGCSSKKKDDLDPACFENSMKTKLTDKRNDYYSEENGFFSSILGLAPYTYTEIVMTNFQGNSIDSLELREADYHMDGSLIKANVHEVCEDLTLVNEKEEMHVRKVL